MSESVDSIYDEPTIHEYPDPEHFAPNVSRHPALLGLDGYVPPTLYNLESGLGECSRDHGTTRERDSLRSPASEPHRFHEPGALDPDYELSDTATTQDEDVTDSTSEDDPQDQRFDLIKNIHNHESQDLNWRPRAQRGQSRGRGRGGRGGKRGLRRAAQPTPEFKALQSQATIAFIDEDFEKAEQLVLQALQINPEIFSAHNLLSEIHAARGDNDKALRAAWNGAHTQPRNPEIWSRIAHLLTERETDDRDSSLREAVYCYNRIISLNSNEVEARYKRAGLNRELGYYGRALREYEQLLKQLPHETSVLRHLAETSIQLQKPERALHYYKITIDHFRNNDPQDNPSFDWSDVNIIAELHSIQQQYDEGLAEVKNMARWLLGRRSASYWDFFTKDDREWDADDEPRRIDVPEFEADAYEISSYGSGLPMELRIKLGVFRIRSRDCDLEEAMNHFEWLDPEDTRAKAKLYDFPDLFREAANSLLEKHYYHEALRYYEPLQYVSDYEDTSYLSEMASCYRAIGSDSEAVECYQHLIAIDESNLNARVQLSNLSKNGVLYSQHSSNTKEVTKRAFTKPNKKIDQQPKRGRSIQNGIPRNKQRSVPQRDLVQASEAKLLFQHWQILMDHHDDRDTNSNNPWMTCANILIQNFRQNKIFYPVDKHHKFYGYSRKARLLAAKPKHAQDRMTERQGDHHANPENEDLVVPHDYCGISFDSWLDVFLEYALKVAKIGDLKGSYEIVAAAFHANVFYHSPHSLFQIHVCWFACALWGNDDETLCNIARWFMREYQFVTDGYRLFAALNKLCDGENSWYNCGPSQKYLLRQIKAVDFSLIEDGQRKSFWQEKASYSTKDRKGNPVQAGDMDVALLMVYGHILFAGRSYSYAVNYFLRALALDPTNATIKLSLALGYIHHALKRQAENRHNILMQGLAFLLEYYDSRQQAASASEKQEADFNVGHVYHLLGLTHQAIPYYERCLELAAAVSSDMLECRGEDFSQTAAFALQGLWAASGNTAMARDITEKWLVM